MNNTRTFLFAALLSSSCTVASRDDLDPEVVTQTLTAADLEAGERPLIDLRDPAVRWIVDGTEMPVDLHQIDIRDATETEPFSAWLVEGSLADESTLEELSSAQITIEPKLDADDGAPPASPEVGQHELGLTQTEEIQGKFRQPNCQIFCYEKCDGGQCKTICMLYCS